MNLKQLFNAALIVSCVASLNARKHVCPSNPTSLAISGGVYMLDPVHTKSKLWGAGCGLDLYVSRANRFGVHAVGQISYTSDSDFDLEKDDDARHIGIAGHFYKEYQGGLKDISISGRISIGKEIIFSHESSNFLQKKGKDCLCTRLYTGLGIALEVDRFKSKDGSASVFIEQAKFVIDKLNSYSVIPGIDLKVFYATDTVTVSPEIFVGPSIYGRGSYTIAYTLTDRELDGTGDTGNNAAKTTGVVKTSQDIGASVYACIPLMYRVSNCSSIGIRFSFKGNYRDEKIKDPISPSNISSTLIGYPGLFGGPKNRDINEPIIENIGVGISIQFTYINI